MRTLADEPLGVFWVAARSRVGYARCLRERGFAMNGRGLIAMPPAAARETCRSRVDFRLAKKAFREKAPQSRNEPTISFAINKSYKTYTRISLANQAICSPFSRKNGEIKRLFCSLPALAMPYGTRVNRGGQRGKGGWADCDIALLSRW